MMVNIGFDGSPFQATRTRSVAQKVRRSVSFFFFFGKEEVLEFES